MEISRSESILAIILMGVLMGLSGVLEREAQMDLHILKLPNITQQRRN